MDRQQGFHARPDIMGVNRVKQGRVDACTYLFTLEWYAEQDYAPQALLDERTQEFLETIDTPAPLPGKGGNFNRRLRVIRDEDRIHKHGFGERARCLPFTRQRVSISTLQN